MIRWQTQENASGHLYEAAYLGTIMVGLVAERGGEFVMECDLPPAPPLQAFDTLIAAQGRLEQRVRDWVNRARLFTPPEGQPVRGGPSRDPRRIRSLLNQADDLWFDFTVTKRTNGRIWVSAHPSGTESVGALCDRLKKLGYDPRMNGAPQTVGENIIEI